MTKKLNLKQCLQWLSLVQLKQQPLTADECYESLHNVLPPPPQPGSPTRRFSKDKVRSYLKELESNEDIISVSSEVTSYSITKKGYENELQLRHSLLKRIRIVHQSLLIIQERVSGRMHTPPVMVPKEDREFVRSLLSVKDVVRYYILDTLKREPKQSLTELQKNMLSSYGWTCSPSYFLLIGRNEMSEGVDEFDDPLEHPVILLQSQYEGKLSRRKIRTYSISDPILTEEWKEIYRRDAAESIGKAITFTTNLLNLLGNNK
ncbi:hypothetical protein [Halalkalibacter flavus]|uniref:hypothetical protein n=1 Tax=Halalkalibacter flavus TaxID=3090668 RepID=UPI002FCA2989